MKLFACIAGCIALSVPGAHADLTLVQNVEGAGPVTTMAIKIKGDKARIESSPEITTIIDSKSGDILNLMNDQKKFVRISANQASAVAEMAVQPDKKDAPAVKPQLKPTGKKETINGYETEEYVCDAPAFKASYWIAPKYPNSAAIVRELQAMTPPSWKVSGKGLPDYRDFPGLPLRSRVSIAEKEIVSTLVSVNQDPLPESDFVTPAGFEEIKMPDMGDVLGRKPPAAKAAASPKP
jgi:hypothetical protein